MDNNLTPCPYCGQMISNDVEKCPHCNEVFKERTIPVKIDSLGLFLVLNFFTLGLYQNIWLLRNLSKINDMALAKKDKLKLGIPVAILVGTVLFLTASFFTYAYYIFGTVPKEMFLLAACLWILSSPLFWICWFLMYIISYRVLRIIEKYTYRQYDIKISHSEIGWLFCPVVFLPLTISMFYLVYFIYTYKERVYNPKPVTV